MELTSIYFMRHSQKIKNTLPQYFRLFNEEIVNILDEIEYYKSGYKILYFLYRNISKDDMKYLWYTKFNENLPGEIETYTDFEKTKYEQYLESQREKNSQQVEKYDNIISKLDKISQPLYIEDSKIETMLVEYVVYNLSKSEVSLFDIFDKIETDSDIPFFMIYSNRKIFYKVNDDYRNHPQMKIWKNTIPETEGIYFYILESNKKSNIGLLQFYPYDKNFIVISIQSPQKIFLFDKIYTLLSNVLEGKLIGVNSHNIKFSFQYKYWNFSKYMFSDFVTNDKIVSYFLFSNEMLKTLPDKKRFFLYFDVTTKNIQDSLTVTFSQPFVNKELLLEVRVNKLRDFQDIEVIQRIFSRLFKYIEDKKEPIIQDYKLHVPSYKKYVVQKKKKIPKEDTKTGKRAKILKNFDPVIFGSGYPKDCDQKQQPYPFKFDQYEKVLKKVGNEPNKIINFPKGSDNYYACEPREETDISDKYVFPGLKYMKNKEGEPIDKLAPCCFMNDQYTAKNSYLRHYLDDTLKQKFEKTKDHILGPTKSLSKGRYGELPYNIQKIMKRLKIKTFTKNKKQYFEIVRYAPDKSVNSIFYCMQLAYDKKFLMKDEDRQIEIVEKIKSKIVGKNITYVDAEKFSDILSHYYKFNILMYIIDDNYTEGNFCFVNLFDYDQTIILIKFKNQSSSFPPYYFEIGCLYKGNPHKDIFTFDTNSEFIQTLMKIQKSSKQDFILLDSGIENFNNTLPKHILSKVKSQIVNSENKTCVINVEYKDSIIPIVINSIDILSSVKKKDKYLPIDEDIAYQFCEKYNFDVIAKDNRFGKLYITLNNPIFNNSYIPLKINKKSISVVNFFSDAKKYVDLLEDITYHFVKSQNQNIEDVEFELSKLPIVEFIQNPKLFIKDGKIQIVDKRIIEKLVQRIKLYIQNDKIDVGLDSKYKNVSDFSVLTNNTIIKSRSNLLKWISMPIETIDGLIYELPQSKKLYPYFFKNSKFDKKLVFIVQNTIYDDLLSAIYICYIWKLKKINLGYKPNIPSDFSSDISRYKYICFDINGNILHKDNDYEFFVLNYKSEVYGAMLIL